MGIVNVTKDSGNQFADNPRPDDMSFTTGVREFHPPYQPKHDWRVIVALASVALVSFIVLWLVYGVWKTIYCWERNYAACQRLTTFEPLVFGILPLIVVSLSVWNVVVRIRAYARQTRMIANRTNLVLDRFGDQVPADLFERMSPQVLLQYLETRYTIANNLERSIAPYKIYRGVNSLSNSSSGGTPMLEATAVEVDETLTPVPPSEWLTWINNQPHVLLAGATGKGKTVTAKPIIAPRIEAGEQLMIIDPHSAQWFGLDVIGGGENWAEIKDAIDQISLEYQTRQNARETYRKIRNAEMPVNAFKRLTVVMDEAFLISLNTSAAPKGSKSSWEMFCQVLGSGARKVNISIIMLSQTANVTDLGLSGPLRENFTRIAVDSRAIKLMIKFEEIDAQRRQQLYEALIGLEYPATTVVDTSVVLLDRAGLDRIPDPVVSSANQYAFVRSQNGQNSSNGHSRTHAHETPADVIAELRKLRAQGVTRSEARIDYGLAFTDSDW